MVFGSYSNYSRPLMEFARESSLRLRQQDTQKFLLPREGVVPHSDQPPNGFFSFVLNQKLESGGPGYKSPEGGEDLIAKPQ